MSPRTAPRKPTSRGSAQTSRLKGDASGSTQKRRPVPHHEHPPETLPPKISVDPPPSCAPQRRRRRDPEQEAGCTIHRRHRRWSIARRDTPWLPQLLSHHKNLGWPQSPDPKGTPIRFYWSRPNPPPERTLVGSIIVIRGWIGALSLVCAIRTEVAAGVPARDLGLWATGPSKSKPAENPWGKHHEILPPSTSTVVILDLLCILFFSTWLDRLHWEFQMQIYHVFVKFLYFTMPSTDPRHRSIQFSIYYFLWVMLIYYLNHFPIILVDNSYTLLCRALALDIGQFSFQFTTFTSYVDLLLKPFSYNFGWYIMG
jgi:hypothetical protein